MRARRYRAEQHFCFAAIPPLPTDVKARASAVGESCDDACDEIDMRCDLRMFDGATERSAAAALRSLTLSLTFSVRIRQRSRDACAAVLNFCEQLDVAFGGCERGCQMSFGRDQPAYLPTQPGGESGGECLVNKNPRIFDCAGKHVQTRRLCPCVAPSDVKGGRG